MQFQLKCVIKDDYPLPIIDEKKSRPEGVIDLTRQEVALKYEKHQKKLI